MLKCFANNTADRFFVHRRCQALLNRLLESLVLIPLHHVHDILEMVVERLPTDLTSIYQFLYGAFIEVLVLEDLIKRILYLDPDILVINPLRPLWEIDLTGNLFAAAAHTDKTELANNVNRLRLGTKHDYYNSGVLLIDLEECRKSISPEHPFQFVAKHEKEMMLPDQDLLNALYGDRILPLEDAIWNYDARNYNTYRMASSGRYDTNWVMDHTAILHFCGRAKPWKPGYLYRFGVLYLHYAHLTSRYLENAAQ